MEYICPSKDILCGDLPQNWCAQCPRRASSILPSPVFARGKYQVTGDEASIGEVQDMLLASPRTKAKPSAECYSPACTRYSACFFPDKCPKKTGYAV